MGLYSVANPAWCNLASLVVSWEWAITLRLKRLRYLDDTFYALMVYCIPLVPCLEFVHSDFTQHERVRTLEEYDVRPYAEDKTIEVLRAMPEIALYLEVAEAAPIFVTRIQTTDREGRIIQYATSKADAFRSRFRVRSTK